MPSKFLFSGDSKPKRSEMPREFDPVRHFEALLMQSFTEMRARAPQRLERA